MAAPQQMRSSRGGSGAGARNGRRRPHGGKFGDSSRGAAAPNFLDINEVLAALQSLYMDSLKPFGRILRKRLAERAAAAGRGTVDIDMSYLRSICSSCPWLRVEDTEGGDWATLFVCYPEVFIDIYSPEDVYPVELWEAAEAYFESLDSEHMVLPGGRYSCAQELIGRRLDFLSGYSLGQVSHIVQLAISQKKLLGYLNGAVVPYARSGSMVKDQCAASQQACAAAPRLSGAELVEWENLRRCLKELMERVPMNGSMPLSNIKRLFRSRFHLELSETALGHSKLSELLNDDRLQDICFVKLQGHGYVVVHPNQRRAHISLSSSIVRQPEELHEEGSLHVAFADVEDGEVSQDASPESSQQPRKYKIVKTFIEVDDDEDAKTPSGKDKKAPKRAQTAPNRFGSDDEDEEDDDEAENCADDGNASADGSCSTGTSPEAPCAGDEADSSLEPMYIMTVMPEGSLASKLSERAESPSPELPLEAFGTSSSPLIGKTLSCSPRVFEVQNTFIHIKGEDETPRVSLARKAKTTTNAQSGVQRVGFGM